MYVKSGCRACLRSSTSSRPSLHPSPSLSLTHSAGTYAFHILTSASFFWSARPAGPRCSLASYIPRRKHFDLGDRSKGRAEGKIERENTRLGIAPCVRVGESPSPQPPRRERESASRLCDVWSRERRKDAASRGCGGQGGFLSHTHDALQTNEPTPRSRALVSGHRRKKIITSRACVDRCCNMRAPIMTCLILSLTDDRQLRYHVMIEKRSTLLRYVFDFFGEFDEPKRTVWKSCLLCRAHNILLNFQIILIAWLAFSAAV